MYIIWYVYIMNIVLSILSSLFRPSLRSVVGWHGSIAGSSKPDPLWLQTEESWQWSEVSSLQTQNTHPLRLCEIPFLLLGSNFPHLSAGMLLAFFWFSIFNITTLLRFQISQLSILDLKYSAFSEIQRLTFSNVAEDSQTRSALRSLSFVLIVVDHAQRRCLAMRGTHHTRDLKRLQETSDFDLIDQVSEDQKYVWYTST